jgi:uracil-DNA glycosylase
MKSLKKQKDKNLDPVLFKDPFPTFPWNIPELEPELEHIKKILSREHQFKIYPEISKIFRGFELVPQNKVNVVIIGQDPYNNGVANGIAFSVDPPKDTENVAIPRSLEVIFREIKRSYQIEKEPKTGDLTSWCKQGVLLINYSFTVFESRPNSHEYLWAGFTYKLVRYLNRENLNLVFMLWGSKAAMLEEIIDSNKHLVLTAPHPASESYSSRSWNESSEDATQYESYRFNKGIKKTFIGCDHFKKANEYLQDKRNIRIDWLTVFE